MDIAILGGGIGGISAAISLKQAGFNPTIYERHQSISEMGAGIVCWPNAIFVLETLGVLQKIEMFGGKITAMSRFSSSGEPLGSLDVSQLNKHMTLPSYSILRRDLMLILTERAQELNISIRYAHQVTAIASQPSGFKTQITFDNGMVIKPDLIIGAEGRMNSPARQFVTGNNTPVFQKFINWIGVYRGNQPLFDQMQVLDFWGCGQRFGIVPINDKSAYWAGGAFVSDLRNIKTEPELFKQELANHFSDWPTPILTLINETPVTSINKIYVHDHDPISTWYKTNVVLLGDAAHAPLPTSGQGACQALEDVWHLTKCLKASPNDITFAFRQYNDIRRTKTAGIIETGRQLARSIFNPNEAYCQQRNLVSKQTDYNAVAQGMAKGWASGLPIGDVSNRVS
ncbi:FAD-dependent monooxygenase [Psychrosphaera sp. B3R10]|uniref:FAD-dependent oxidoreductase n=1 Tax=unclassified Psychrosphaera TaxID=2641570 RepID=UPI001C0A4E8D|nr:MULTISPECIES: FAD-dependent monooxygenase [unclassified Psychrosphaera]MBU2883001.1 FAD-dependent monooxygenase [Psychrosphaera sp. I2R16]MBU2991398.1 FAD-dependent monooxygenase [Psychrosphaera sp. B3R10]